MRLLPSLTALLLCLPSSFAASLLAIDYGTDGFKAALVKPGVPFDVLINKDSKRKTPSIVALRGEDRSFGGEAANLVRRGALLPSFDEELTSATSCGRRLVSPRTRYRPSSSSSGTPPPTPKRSSTPPYTQTHLPRHPAAPQPSPLPQALSRSRKS